MNTTVLDLKNVSMSYGDGRSRVQALKNATFSVHRGELVGLIGPSGSGKSTLLSIAGLLLTPSEGDVELDGRNVSATDKKKAVDMRLEKIGFIFQGSNLISYLTAKENLQFIGELRGRTPEETSKKADGLLHELGMDDRASSYPDQLSGGERQRIAIARALMNEPELILADEPTASLDSTRGRQVVELLAEEVHRRNAAGIIVTHDERLIDVCDRVLRISDGQVSED